ncbi:hypothetical protein [Bacillus sp. WP8]|nr:hypothetical protein [Bacillus sp. WP8]
MEKGNDGSKDFKQGGGALNEKRNDLCGGIGSVYGKDGGKELKDIW